MSEEDIFHYTDREEYQLPRTVSMEPTGGNKEKWICTKIGKIVVSVCGSVVVLLIIILPSCLASRGGSGGGGKADITGCDVVRHINKIYSDLDDSYSPDPCATYKMFYVLDWYLGLVSKKYLLGTEVPIYLYGAKKEELHIKGEGYNKRFKSSKGKLTIKDLPSSIEGVYTITLLDRTYTIEMVKWEGVVGEGIVGGVLEIPHGVNVIKKSQYKDLGKLSTVMLPPSIVEIEEEAFSNTKMSHIIIPDGCKTMGHNAFRNSGIKYAILPPSVEKMVGNPFCYLPSGVTFIAPSGVFVGSELCLIDVRTMTLIAIASPLKLSALTDGVEAIGSYSFADHKSIAEVVVGADVRRIEERAFSGCSGLIRATLQDNVEYIGPYAFEGTGLLFLGIPDSLKEIGEGAFLDVATLMGLILNKSKLRLIGAKAFSGTGLGSFVLPNSVKEIGREAFAGSALESLSNDADSELATIGELAFSSTNITAFNITKKVKTIKGNPFVSCTKLTSLASSSKSFTFEEKMLRGNKGRTVVFVMLASEDLSFTVPKDITAIASFAFYKTNITSLVLEEGTLLSAVGEGAFEGTSLVNFTFPAAVVSVGPRAFANIPLASLSFADESKLAEIAREAFQGTALTQVVLPSSVVSVGDKAFDVSGGIILNAKKTQSSETFLSLQSCTMEELSLIQCNCVRTTNTKSTCNEV